MIDHAASKRSRRLDSAVWSICHPACRAPALARLWRCVTGPGGTTGPAAAWTGTLPTSSPPMSQAPPGNGMPAGKLRPAVAAAGGATCGRESRSPCGGDALRPQREREPPLCAGSCCRMARSAASQIRVRLPWERPAPPGRLTPARVRRGFRNIRATAAQPAGAPNPVSPDPAGHQDRRTAARHLATTWGKRPEEKSRSRQDTNAQVKRQAQALTHLALISAAFNLDRALGA